ncbi:opsin-3 [Hyperolius riggenbachi]|uniref:opsin-3 n=1 Tax=Hyperolius riggenbachi TaxID=752182 RepID=UPI0035A26DD7
MKEKDQEDFRELGDAPVFMEVMEKDLKSIEWNNDRSSNLTKDQQKALKELQAMNKENGSSLNLRAYNEELFTRDNYDFLALLVAIIGAFGLLSNLLVLILYCRFKTLRTPTNLLLVNISFSDFFISLFGVSFTFSSCVSQKWIWGEAGCVFDGFCKTLLGNVSIFTLTVVAYERYIRVAHDKAVDFRWTWEAITYIWLYALLWAIVPLMQWDRYVLELHELDCSLDRATINPNHSSFILLSFLSCFVAPMGIMTYCYGSIIYSVRMLQKVYGLGSSHVLRLVDCEIKLAKMCLLMVLAFLLCWMPYSLLSLLVMRGHWRIITPTRAFVPSLLVKIMAATNPLIYILTSKRFRQGLVKLLWIKMLRSRIMFGRKKRPVGANVKLYKDGKKLKKRVLYTSSSFSSVITTGETDAQQSDEHKESVNSPNVKIIYVQPYK